MNHVRQIKVLLLVAMMVLLNACAAPIDMAAQRAVRVDVLTRDIQQLSPAISWQEAHDFASVAVETSAELGLKYEVVLKPWLHNLSVVTGLKQRGLCYEYAKDLYASLKLVSSEHLVMYYVRANRGKINEHHALTVVVKDAEWDSGLILDAWRSNGNLYFAPLKADKYPWVYEANAPFASANATASTEPGAQ